MHFSTVLALAACFHIHFSSTVATIPKIRPPKEELETPTTPHSPDPPVVPNPGHYPGQGEPNAVPSQQNIQNDMGKVEKELAKMARDAGTELIDKMVNGDAQKSMVDAIRSAQHPTCTWREEATVTTSTTETVTFHYGPPIKTSSVKGCTGSVDFTPTSTLPTTSFAACTSFASMLVSCSQETESFFALGATAQASCACYSTPSTIGCTGSVEAQKTAFPSLDGSFDESAGACWSYFALQGYDNIAQVMGGRADDKTVLGNQFCANVDADLKRKNGNASASGLSEKLPGIAYTDCEGLVDSSGGNQKVASASSRDVVPFRGASMALIVGSLLAFAL